MERKTIIATLDMKDACSTEDEVEIILASLHRHNVYRPDLLYRGFDGTRASTVRRTGSDVPKSPSIYCSDEDQLREKHGFEDYTNPLDYAFTFTKPAISVYHPQFLEFAGQENEYRFKTGMDRRSAVAAIFQLKYPSFK